MVLASQKSLVDLTCVQWLIAITPKDNHEYAQDCNVFIMCGVSYR